ncbi:hypothetical protein UlMin_017738 [Ulmus minor]
MAVHSEFGSSLLENLKLEDPWLPSSCWESIPSESGPRLPQFSHSSSIPDPLRHASSLSEASLVRLAMNGLQGVQSALISLEKISSAFCCDLADRTFHQIPNLWNRSASTHAQGKILKSIGCSGLLIFLLRRFVDYFRNSNSDGSISGMRRDGYSQPAGTQIHHDAEVLEEHPPYSLVNHAFSVAVGKIIEGYVCALDTLYASVHLRHSSESAEMSLRESSAVGCLNSIVYSEITLLELYLHTKELRTRIEALGNICNLHNIASSFSESSFEEIIAKAKFEFHSFCRGGNLLTYLYTQLKVADPPHHAVLKFLFLRSCEPYCGFIRSWIYKAEISDPYKEFIVEYLDNLLPYQHGKAGISPEIPLASVRDRDGVAIPCFLKDYVIPLFRAGQQLQVLMKLLELGTYVASEGQTYEDLLPCWSGFSSNHPSYVFPVTQTKENIETRVIARASYYKRMQEKLETVLKNLEFKYQQVVSHDSVPNGLGSAWRSVNYPVSFKLDNSLIAASPENRRDINGGSDDTESDDSNTADDLSDEANKYESSECSSSYDAEEQFVSEQPTKVSSHMVELQEKYFSPLIFSVSPHIHNSMEKAHECEESYHTRSDSDGICGRVDENCQDEQSLHNGMSLSQIFVATESEKPNWLVMSDPQYVGNLFDPSWPVNGFSKSSVSLDNNYRDTSCSHLLDSDPKMSKTGSLKEGISYYSKMMLMNSASLAEELFGKDRLENSICTSDLFITQDWKFNSGNNFFSMNPMLRKNTFLKLQTVHGERNGIQCGKSLPYFDFSSVEDPCKGCVENISVGFIDSGVSANIGKNDAQDRHCNDKEAALIDKTKICGATEPSELKDCNKENASLMSFSGGSSWESLLRRSLITVSNSVGAHNKSLLAKFEMPLDFIIDKCLFQEIMLQYKYISKLTIKLLEEEFDLQEHLLALRRYHFMEFADWADLFIMSLWHHKWSVTEAEQRLPEIQGFLELSIQRSSCEYDRNKDKLYVYIKGHDTMHLSTSPIGLHSFDFLGLGYRVDWPVSIVLTPVALKIYSEIFSFLIQVKLAIFALTDVWRSLKELWPLISKRDNAELHQREVTHFNLLMKIRHQVNHFVSTLQQYVESQLSHVSWCRFLHSLQHKVKDMMDLESVHMSYLTDSLHICFLSDEMRPVASIIDSILQCALDFRSCLRGGMWGVGIIDKGDLEGRLSRINISQVLVIKKTFDKNLRDLHLYYLKSPKHGDYRLSRFWDYLNYNGFYSDGSNPMGYYAFSI